MNTSKTVVLSVASPDWDKYRTAADALFLLTGLNAECKIELTHVDSLNAVSTYYSVDSAILEKFAFPIL